MFYSAPNQVKKRMQDWGPRGYQQRVAVALRNFVGWSRVWLQVLRSHGASAASAVWREVHAGRVAPEVGQIVSLCN
jgi:hypothetical protein